MEDLEEMGPPSASSDRAPWGGGYGNGRHGSFYSDDGYGDGTGTSQGGARGGRYGGKQQQQPEKIVHQDFYNGELGGLKGNK